MARRSGSPVFLTDREFAILEVLALRKGALVTKLELLDSVYGRDAEVSKGLLNYHLHKLRRKIGSCLQTVGKQGFILSEP